MQPSGRSSLLRPQEKHERKRKKEGRKVVCWVSSRKAVIILLCINWLTFVRQSESPETIHNSKGRMLRTMVMLAELVLPLPR